MLSGLLCTDTLRVRLALLQPNTRLPTQDAVLHETRYFLSSVAGCPIHNNLYNRLPLHRSSYHLPCDSCGIVGRKIAGKNSRACIWSKKQYKKLSALPNKGWGQKMKHVFAAYHTHKLSEQDNIKKYLNSSVVCKKTSRYLYSLMAVS